LGGYDRENEGGIRDGRTSNGRMRDKNILAGVGFADFDRWDAGYLVLKLNAG